MISRLKPINTCFFIIGLVILAVGVSVSVRANLGVTPISCVPYVFSLGTPYSLGELTIFMNTLFILMQIVVARRKYSPFQLLQFPAVVILGYCIDYTLPLVSGITPTSYPEQVFWLLVSCLLIALGVFTLVKADILYVPGDGLILVVSETFKLDFGKTKMCFDSSMVFFGAISSFLLISRLEGIREGTVIAALLVGYLVRLLVKAWAVVMPKIGLGRGELAAEAVEPMPGGYGAYPVITISREYGSGGHAIGQAIAMRLGYSFFDRKLVDLTAAQSGFDKAFISENEQKITNSLFHELYAQNYAYVKDKLPPSDVLFLVQSKIIRDVCSKGPCVIVGRCANFILKDNPNCFNVFVHANEEYRIGKIVDDYHAEPSYSYRDLERTDHERANYCLKYTGKDWRDAANYHVTLDSAAYSTEEIAERIIELFRDLQPRLKEAA